MRALREQLRRARPLPVSRARDASIGRDRAAAGLVRAHALVRAQVPVLRFQLASIEVGGARRVVHRCADPRLRCGTAAGRGPPDRHGILRRRHAEPVPARGFQPAARRVAAAHRVRRTMPKSRWKPIPGPSNAADSRATGTPASIECHWGRRLSRRGRCEALGRIHSADDTHRAVAELRAAKLDNFNLDLMYALPEQTQEEALEDVRIACALEPAHISYYQLTLEPGTVFHARPPQLPDEDAAWADSNRGPGAAGRCGLRAVRSIGVRARRARAAGTT